MRSRSWRSDQMALPGAASTNWLVTRMQVPLFPNAAFEEITHAELAAHLAHVMGASLVEKAELRAMTKNQRSRARAIVISSVMPSLKYSCAGSPERNSRRHPFSTLRLRGRT